MHCRGKSSSGSIAILADHQTGFALIRVRWDLQIERRWDVAEHAAGQVKLGTMARAKKATRPVIPQVRRADVRAIAPTTLLVLDEERFWRLLERSRALREAVLTSAEKRGIQAAGLLPTEVDGS